MVISARFYHPFPLRNGNCGHLSFSLPFSVLVVETASVDASAEAFASTPIFSNGCGFLNFNSLVRQWLEKRFESCATLAYTKNVVSVLI